MRTPRLVSSVPNSCKTTSFEQTCVGHEDSSVYMAATLKSQTVWFMAEGRDRDQRSASCWVGSRFPLAPLPSLPGTQHRARPPGPSRRMWGILNTFAHCFATSHPHGDVKSAAGPEDGTHLAEQWAQGWCKRRPWAEDQGNLSARCRTASGTAHCWESESSWTELLSFVQHNKDQIMYFCHGPCWMKSKTPRSWSKVLACWSSRRATNKYDGQERSRRIGSTLCFPYSAWLVYSKKTTSSFPGEAWSWEEVS